MDPDGFAFIPPDLDRSVLESCTLIDGRGVVPHFWWLATAEYLSQDS
jgi:hypothetical protein